VTGTGPVLVVHQGDDVTLTLTDQLADRVSLAIPGMKGLVDDRTGAAGGGGTATYRFTPSRPGTYLYEAGHTANGDRQAAMGLVGALIVRPQGFDAATARTDLDVAAPASGFDDEAVLVLSDLDPALNANPTGFDMRNFRAGYRMINGKVFPQTDAIPTQAGNRVLLRYVNAGVTSHSMGAEGLRQRVVALSAHPADGADLAADTITAGETEDVTVTEPAGGGNHAVYDTSGALDSNGILDQGTVTPPPGGTVTRQLAFGGMMTLLGTDVTPPATDVIGPRSTITGVSPNPVKATDTLTVTATFSDAATGGAAIDDAVVLIDGAVNTTDPATATHHFTGGTVSFSAAELGAQGDHRVYVLAKDANGNWGVPTSAVVTVSVSGAVTTGLSLTPNPSGGTAPVAVKATGDDSALGGTVTAAEFFVDSQGADGSGTAMSVPSPAVATAPETGSLDPSGLTDGQHTVYVHTQDSFGLWGTVATATLSVDRVGPAVSSGSITPNPTDGTVGDPVDRTALKVTGTFADPAVTGTAAGSTIVAAEGFFPAQSGGVQTPPGTADYGHGFTFVASDGAWDKPAETGYGLIPLTQLTGYPDGPYQVWIHARDAAGNWGTLTPYTLTIQRGLFADGFETGNTANWTGAAPVGGTRLQVNAAAAIAGAQGLQVSGSGTSPAYVTTPAISPAATGYHARFSFNPNTLRTGTGQVGLLTALPGATGTTFQVQYRRANTPATAARQVRLVVYRSATATSTTAWVTVPTGSSSIQVDWVAGTSATVTLTVNGVATSLTGVNTSAPAVNKVVSARFGLVGATAAVTGSAYLDAYTSSRNALK
jgi:hypothetical protein